MKQFIINDADGNTVMTVEANSAASAKMAAKRQGWRRFCTAEEIREESSIPGKAEYEKVLSWKTVCDGIAADENLTDREAASDILGAISGTYTRESRQYPAFRDQAIENGFDFEEMLSDAREQLHDDEVEDLW